MAVPHSRLILGGHNGGGDTWSTGLSFVGGESSSQADLQTWINSIATAVGQAFNGGTDHWGLITSVHTHLERLSVYTYPTPGAPANRLAEHIYTSPINGAGGDVLPYEASVVATLLTGVPGRINRGRMYLPAEGANLTTSQLTAADATSVAKGVVALIDVVNGSTLSGGNPSVVVAGQAQTNVLQVVTAVRVDTLIDVQRRRQNRVNPIGRVTEAV